MTTAPNDDRELLWVERYERDRNGFAEVLTWDPFREWERNAMPESSVQQELRGALYVAYAWGVDHEQAVAFLNRACKAAERTINEDKLTSALSVASFPLNRGTLHRDYSYARAILGERLDEEALRQSSRDFEEWCKKYGKGQWDSQAQANYLAAVRLASITGDIDRARELLKTKKSFNWHKVEHELWKRLVELSGTVRADAEFSEYFMEYFDKFRDPRFIPDVYMETDVLRLELAAIRDKYLVSGYGEIDWSRAVDSVPG